MKKNLLILAFAAPFAFGQTFYVGSEASVKVKPKTLLYSTGDVRVVESQEGRVSNEGNVKVDGKFIGSDVSSRFVNHFKDGENYGQLIIKGAATGKMTGEYKFVDKTLFAYQPIAFPFKDYTAGEAVEHSGIENPTWYPKTRSESRYLSPIFTVENTKSQSVNNASGDKLEPTGAHSINQSLVTKTGVHSFKGTPASGEHNVNFKDFKVEKKNSEFNEYGEFIGGNVVDPTRTAPQGWGQFRTVKGVSAGDYGRNIYTLGNPYTSNIDLSKLPSEVDVVIVYESAKFESNFSDNPNSAVANITFETPSGALGDNRVIIRPYQLFVVRTIDDKALSFTFNNDFKTFDTTSKIHTYTYSSARNVRANENTSGIYQLGLDLYSNDSKTGNRFYVVASDMYEAKGNSRYEAYNLWLGDDVGFYSLQEKADGTIAEELSDQKVYINGINATDYVAKPIHLVFQGKDNKPYTLKAQDNAMLFNSSNKFYFEDKKTGIVKEITPDFEYTFVEPTLNKDRFVIYWNGLPQTMATHDVASSQTQIYKDGVDHKVRFATEFNKADIYVYDLNGRLVSAEKAINASLDYTLPYLAKGSVFVVKVVGDNGVVTTHKIIK